jgi:hypothetical protein
MENILKYLITLSLILSTCLCNDQAGVKIAIKQDVIEGFERKLLPLLSDQLKYLAIPDTEMSVDAKIGTLHIYLKNIHFSISNIIPENIIIGFAEPNKLNVHAHQIQGNGHLDVRFKLGFVSETDSINVKINHLSSDAEITLGVQESTKIKGKMMPTACISNISIDLDFDFDIHGSLIAYIASLVKSRIKDYIYSQIQSEMKQVIMDQTKQIISSLVDQLPVYAPLDDNGLALDYSLLSSPKVTNGYLILNSNGAIVNLNHPESLNPPFVQPTTLPDFDPNGKLMQMFLSDYSINTAINSVFLSNMLDVTIKSEDVPSDSPLQLNTTSLEMLVRGISDVYGKDKKVDLQSKVTTRPDVWMSENFLNGTTVTELSLLVRNDNGTHDVALRFNTTISGSGDVHVQSQGQISAWIHSLELSNSTLIESQLKEADINHIEIMFNFATKIVLPILNNNYLKKITIKLPEIEGITFNDSTVEIENQYVEMNVTPQFDKIFKATMGYFKSSRNKKEKVSKNKIVKEIKINELEVEEGLFLSWAH